MTPTEARLIPRVLTVVAMMLLMAGVVGMHSFMTGHAPMAHAGPITATVAQHSMGTTPRTPPSTPSREYPHATGGTSMQKVDALNTLTAPMAPSADGVGAMCLAVLPALALLLILLLVRQHGGQRMAPFARHGTIRQRVGIRGSPPRRTTPSLSQLCVLRA